MSCLVAFSATSKRCLRFIRTLDNNFSKRNSFWEPLLEPWRFDIESRQGDSTITDTILDYCKQHGIELYRKNGTLKNIEFKETHIPVGKDLYIMGIASKNKYKDPASKSEQNDNMIGYQFRQRIFYISDKSEKEILTNSVQNSRVMLIGGMVLSVIGLIGVMDFFK